MPYFSLVIPCYNEEKNLNKLFKKFSNDFNNLDLEVILVNNGSTDKSKKMMLNFSKKYNFVKIVNLRINEGYGNGILKGLQKSSGKIIGWTHADLQTDPNDFIKAIKICQKNLNDKIFIKGQRYGRSFFDLLFTWGMTFFEFFILKTWLLDINAQPTIFSRELYLNMKNPPKDFSLDLFTFFLAKKLNYKIFRFKVYFGPRFSGVGHNDGIKSKVKYSLRTINFSIKLLKNKLL